MNVFDQILIIWAGTKGYLDKVERPKVREWEEAFLRFMREQRREARDALAKGRKLTPDVEKQLTAAADAFQAQYHPTRAQAITGAAPPPAPSPGIKTEAATTGVAKGGH
jgi:F0F1-type ATP synthase alpha subunit